jgi:hypothetical protein
MSLNPSLFPHPSKQHAAWEKALHGGDDALLERLASSDEPDAALLELETYINGIYRGSQLPISRPLPDIRFEVRRLLPYLDEIRARLGWSIRDFDLGLLRLIRRSSALSPVLGAGVSMIDDFLDWAAAVHGFSHVHHFSSLLHLHEPRVLDRRAE